MPFVPLTLREQITQVVEGWPVVALEQGQNYARMSMLDAAIYCDAFLDAGEANAVTLSVDYVTNTRSDLRLGAVVKVGTDPADKFMLCSDSGALLLVNNTQDLVDIWTTLYEAGVRVVFGDTSLVDPPPNLDLKAPDVEMGQRLVDRYKAALVQREKLTHQLEALNAKVQTKAVRAKKLENAAREKALAIRCGTYTGLINIFAPDLLTQILD